MRRRPNHLRWMCALAVGVPAAASPARDPGSGGPDAVAIDQGYADRNALSVSLKDVAPDFRADTHWERLYRLPGQSGMLMRQKGAVTAVFPASAYEWREFRRNDFREVVLTPASTVFILGNPEEHLPGMKSPVELFGIGKATPLPDPGADRPTLEEPQSLRVNGPEDTTVRTDPVAGVLAPGEPPPLVARPAEQAEPEKASSPPPRDMSSEVFRRQRLRELAVRLGPA